MGPRPGLFLNLLLGLCCFSQLSAFGSQIEFCESQVEPETQSPRPSTAERRRQFVLRLISRFDTMKTGYDPDTGQFVQGRFFEYDLPIRVVEREEDAQGDPARLLPYFDPSLGFGIELQFSPLAWERPELLAEVLYRLALLHGSDGVEFVNRELKVSRALSKTHPELRFGTRDEFQFFVESVENARLGSPHARAWLKQQEAEARRRALTSLEAPRNPLFLGEDPSSARGRGRESVAEAELEARQSKELSQVEEGRAQVEWSTRLAALKSLDRTQLAELVSGGRRAETAALLRAHLPFVLMEPLEKRAWESWLDAIANPDPGRSKLAFRGLRGSKFEKETDRGLYQFATVLSAASGGPSSGLLELEKGRSSNALWYRSERRADVPISRQFHSHAQQPVQSAFLSAADLSTALFFANGEGPTELIGVRIDERRLVPNFMSGYHGEFELLIPMFVFPDEVIAHYDLSGALGSYLRHKNALDRVDFDRLRDAGPSSPQVATRLEQEILRGQKGINRFYQVVRRDIERALGRRLQPGDFVLGKMYTDLTEEKPARLSTIQHGLLATWIPLTSIGVEQVEPTRDSDLVEYFARGQGFVRGLQQQNVSEPK